MSFFLLLGLTLASPALAAINAQTTGLEATAAATYYDTTPISLPVLIGKIIDVVVGLSGLLVFILFVYAGFIWMTAQGDPTKVKKAQDILATATIGLLILLSAFAITNFVVTQLDVATTPTL